MEPGSENAPLFKRSTRVPLEAVVRLHFEGTVAYQNGFAANVSATGMFVKYPDPPPVGTKLVFEFTIGQLRRPVQGVGRVVWVREKYEGPGKPAGVGIEFMQLDAQSREHIAEALFEYLEESLGNEMLDLPSLTAEEAQADERTIRPERPAEAATATPGLASEPVPAFEPLVPPPPALPLAAEPPALEPPPLGPTEPLAFPMAPPRDADEPRSRWEGSTAIPDPKPAAASVLEPRAAMASSSRRATVWPWLAAALILAAGGFAVWRFYLAPEPPPPQPPPHRAVAAPPPKPARPPLPANPGPSGTLVQTVGATSTPPDATRPAAGPAPPEEADTTTSDSGGATPAEPAPNPPANPPDNPVSAPASPAPSAGAVASPPAKAAPAPTPEPEIKALPRATGIDAIDWTEATGITIVTVSGDGPFADGTVHYYEIGGDSPRILVKVQSVGRAFGKGTLTVGTAAVRTIRNAAHPSPGGGEVHIVIDLATPAPRLVGVEIAGSRIVVKLAAAK
ncbi:MAG: PilZ domain-containing protein [Thermoanaerobaculia bacterium]